MTITNAQRDRLRTHPQLIKSYLSVLVPGEVYCGTVNGDQARGEMDIPVVNVSGNINNTLEGMTVLVGTSCGDDSISRRRVRDNSQIGANIITLDENSMDLEGGEFITVLRNFELWPKYPRILTVDPWTFFKDYDITYTDENEDINPVAMAGSHQAGFLDAGEATFTLDATDSYALASGATINGYSWGATGGVIDNAAVASTTITFDTAGTYWITLIVSDTNGKTHTTRRVIFVHDTANMPYTEFEFESPPSGDWDRGGWETTIRVRGGATGSDFPDGTLVVVWCESWYAGVQDEIAAEVVGDNILFAGYIRRDSVTQDWDTGSVSFEATTIEGVMKQHMMFSISLQAPTGEDNQVLPRDPQKWYEFDANNLTVATALHHLWYWHSTLFDITDVYLPTDNTLLIYAVDDFEQGNLYDQASGFCREHGIFAHVVCNKKGQVYVEVDVNMLEDADRAAVSLVWNGGVQDTDRRDEIEILRQPELQVAMVHFSGFTFDGATSTALISKAPGDAPEAQGSSVKNVERQVLDDQAQANAIAGRALAVENDSFKEFRIKFAGNYAGTLDMVPQEWLELSIAAGDTPRGITLTDERLVCRTLQTEINTADGYLLTDAVFVRDASGNDGVTGDYPTDPPPSPEPPPPVWPPPVDGNDSGALIAWDESEGCWIRLPGNVSWIERDAGLPAGAVDDDNQGGWDPWWFTPEKHNTSDPNFAILWRVQDGAIYRSINAGVTWEEFTPTDAPPNFYDDSPAPTAADVIWIQRADNIHINEEHYFLGYWQEPLGKYRGFILRTTDDGETSTWHSLGKSARNTSYIMTEDFGLYSTTDFTYDAAVPVWTNTSDRLVNVRQFAIDLNNADEFQAMLQGNDVYVRRPTFYGDTDWHVVLTPVMAAAIAQPLFPLETYVDLAAVEINSDSQAAKAGHMYTIAVTAYNNPAAVSHARCFRSTNYGQSWSLVGTIRANRSIRTVGNEGGAFFASRVDGNILYASMALGPASTATVQVSTDEGANWAEKDAIDVGGWITRVWPNPVDDNISYAGDGIGGPDLRAAIVPAGKYNTFIRAGAGIPHAPNVAYMWMSKYSSHYIRAVKGSNLRYTDDGGLSWATVAAGDQDNEIWGADGLPFRLCTGRNNNGGVPNPHIIRSTEDTGTTWFDKAGTNAGVDDTGGGDSIPKNCGGVTKEGIYTIEAESLRPVWMDVDSEDGTRIYVSMWLNGAWLVDSRLASNPTSNQKEIHVGYSTQAEMESRAMVAYPQTPLGDKDYLVVFGRFFNPWWSIGLQHVVRSINQGDSFTLLVDDWGADVCSALQVGADDGLGFREYVAIRDAGLTYPASLYKDTGDLTYVTDLPFGNDRGVLVDALTQPPGASPTTTSIAVGADAAGAVMIVITDEETGWTVWEDITENYPTIGVVRSLTYV